MSTAEKQTFIDEAKAAFSKITSAHVVRQALYEGTGDTPYSVQVIFDQKATKDPRTIWLATRTVADSHRSEVFHRYVNGQWYQSDDDKHYSALDTSQGIKLMNPDEALKILDPQLYSAVIKNGEQLQGDGLIAFKSSTTKAEDIPELIGGGSGNLGSVKNLQISVSFNEKTKLLERVDLEFNTEFAGKDGKMPIKLTYELTVPSRNDIDPIKLP